MLSIRQTNCSLEATIQRAGLEAVVPTQIRESFQVNVRFSTIRWWTQFCECTNCNGVVLSHVFGQLSWVGTDFARRWWRCWLHCRHCFERRKVRTGSRRRARI